MEWPVVFVPWCSEGLFPSQKASEEGRLDEERRLFYVVVTRAKDRLYLFSPAMRRMPEGGVFPVEPNVFVKEIPADLVETRRMMSGTYFDPGGRRSSGYGGGYGRSRGNVTYKTIWRR